MTDEAGREAAGVRDHQRDRLSRLLAGGVAREDFSGWARMACEVACAEADVDAAAISLRSASDAQRLAGASDEWSSGLEELQLTVGEGPGDLAFRTRVPELVDDLGADARWPGFTTAALARGVGAVFAFPLTGSGTPLGTMSLYRRTPRPLAPDAVACLTALGELAVAVILAGAAGTAATAWQSVPGDYDDVNVAAGVLAGALHIDVAEALLRLRAHAFSHDRSLLDVANAVVTGQVACEQFGD